MRNSKHFFPILVVLGLILIGYIVVDTLNQPGMERFEGKYESIDFFRNQNNTGPVIRVYAIQVLDEDSAWMKAFGDAQPHGKYGKTMVFFFSKKAPEAINLSPVEPFFSAAWKDYLRASYQKMPMGDVQFSVVKDDQ